MPRGVTGREAHFELHVPKPQELTVRKIDRRFGAGIDLETEQRAASARAPEHVVVRVQGNEREGIQRIGDLGRAADVIKMGVRIPQVCDAPGPFLGFGEDQPPVPGGVDHGRVAGGGIRDEVGVGHGGAEGEGDNFKHGRSGFVCSVGFKWRGQARDEDQANEGRDRQKSKRERIRGGGIACVQESSQGRRHNDNDGAYGFHQAEGESHL